jgi:glycogen synthase
MTLETTSTKSSPGGEAQFSSKASSSLHLTPPPNQTVFTFVSRIDCMKGLDRANRMIEIAGREIPFTWSIQQSN